MTDAQIVTHGITADGKGYIITVTYGDETGIPKDACLDAKEILPEDPIEQEGAADGMLYEDYVASTEEALEMEMGTAGYFRLFDIKIVNADGEKIKPAEGTCVDVRIELEDAESEGLSVVHFADGETNGDVVESTTEQS